MKKLNLLVLLLIAGISSGHAKEVSPATAQTAGFNYLAQHGSPLSSPTDLHLVYTSGTPAHFYVFSADRSFVMVSADDAVTPILAYSTDRAFNGIRIAPHVLSFLSNYDVQIAHVQSAHAVGTTATAQKWNQLINNIKPATAAKTTSATPLLHTTWDQSPYYNDLCPYDYSESELTVTGCVATATAQVMKYWNWPTTGVGSHSYTWSTYGTLSANFATTTYNWAGMPNSISGANTAIATLMYHVGVAVEMQYGPGATGGSGAYVISAMSPITNCAEYALKTYFRYDASTIHGVMRSDYSDAAWISAIKAEINASRPVIYAGSGSGGGHCFVADGYDASDYLHINWGWSGYGPDGYYSVDALDPPDLGTGGGGGGGFDAYQHAIIGLKPTGAAPAPDMYEVNNTSATAYTLPLTFVSNVATKSTTGSNFHLGTDEDYYKIVLAPGYKYSIDARLNDASATDDATTYTVDANWYYSTDSGTTWHGPYDNTMSGTINVTGHTGGTVMFHVAHVMTGSTGTYLLKLSSVTRTPSVGVAVLEEGSVKVYPNPATQMIYADLSGTATSHAEATLLDMAGRNVATAQAGSDHIISIPVNGLSNGMYLLQISTDAGSITKKITVSNK